MAMSPDEIRTLRALMEYEAARAAPPPGFPDLPDIPAGRYTDPRFFALEMQYLWRKSWLLVQSVPLGEILLTFVWLILHLAILAVGALAYWYRPFDRPARLFLVMGIVTLTELPESAGTAVALAGRGTVAVIDRPVSILGGEFHRLRVM